VELCRARSERLLPGTAARIRMKLSKRVGFTFRAWFRLVNTTVASGMSRSAPPPAPRGAGAPMCGSVRKLLTCPPPRGPAPPQRARGANGSRGLAIPTNQNPAEVRAQHALSALGGRAGAGLVGDAAGEEGEALGEEGRVLRGDHLDETHGVSD